MADKTIMLLLVLFVAVGVAAYDRHAVQNGKLSPIGQLVDFAGLSKKAFQKENPDDLVVTKEMRTFKYQSGQRLARLQKKYKEIEDERVKLVENRQEILQNLMNMIQDTEDDAVQYARVINQEKKRFNQKFPKFDKWRKSLLDLQQETDPVLRDTKYQALKNELLSSLGERSDQSKLELTLENLQKVIDGREEDSIVMEDCGDLEHCIEKNVDVIENNLNEIGNLENDGIKDIVKLINTLKGEYQYQMDQSYVREVDFEKSHKKINSKLKSMVEQLVEVTANDLRDLIFLYQELDAEQRMLFEDMDAEQQYWKYQHKKSMRKIKEKIVSLKKNFRPFSNQLREKNRDLEYKQKNMEQQAQYNLENMRHSVEKRFESNHEFIGEVAGLINIDIKRLVTDQNYAIKKNATYLRDRRVMQNRIMARSKAEIDQKRMGGLATEIKSGLTRSPELRKTEPIRRLNRFGLKE